MYFLLLLSNNVYTCLATIVKVYLIIKTIEMETNYHFELDLLHKYKCIIGIHLKTWKNS